ncbi:MAG: hypothetical protein KTR13_04610, partial [Saprospiraceae bacterium]|nr:hypothetical protein [Saprospiraceae bacterium]
MDELNIQLRLGSFTIDKDWQMAIDKPKKYSDVFDEYGNCEAFIRISSKDLEVNVFEDEIIPLVKHICFGSIPTLIEGKSFVYRIFSFYGYIRLDPEGD